MNKILLIAVIAFAVSFASPAQTLKLTGGVSLTRGTIDADALKEVIQQKQEEVFTRLFSNIVVKYFSNKTIKDGVYNFPTYYALYSLMTDLTVGKSRTTVSKTVINSAAELAYIYSFVSFYQNEQLNIAATASKDTRDREYTKKINNLSYVKTVVKGKAQKDTANLIMLNYYMEAAFDVLAKSMEIQDEFYFKRSLESTEINRWYMAIGMVNDPEKNNTRFRNVAGKEQTLNEMIADMETKVDDFLSYSATGSDTVLATVTGLKKKATGFESIKAKEINCIKLLLLEYANKTDYLFDRNVVKSLINLVVENTHVEINTDQNFNQVYVDVESLILSLDREFVTKNKSSSISSDIWFINPKLFFTIGASTGFFLNHKNQLDKIDGMPAALKNVNLAAEKVGFRVKVWDGGYTRSFGPGEVYKWHGKNHVWTEPRQKPLIYSVYYNIYGSGLLYNVLNLKTNDNFNFGYLSSNIGIIFFNGLEFSAGIGIVYRDGLNAKNSFLKIDFDVPVIDYLAALRKRRQN